ncbi:hypothetical protein RCL1_004743 [Eukaryota sp. TZLM3-RCL]
MSSFEYDLDFDLNTDIFGETVAEEKDPTKRAVLIAIDANPSSFQKSSVKTENPDIREELPIVLCLKTVSQLIRNCVFESESDEFAIVFFHTEETDNEWKVPHIQTFSNFVLPGAEIIQRIQSLIHDIETGTSPVVPSQSFDPSHVLFLAHQFLASKPTASFNKYLYIFSNSSPSSSSSSIVDTCRTRVNDLHLSKVELHYFPLPPLTFNDFISIPFWSLISEPQGDVSKLTINYDPGLPGESIRRKGVRRRPLARLPFYLSDTKAMGVTTFSVILPAKVPPGATLHRETNQLLQTRSMLMDGETFVEVAKDDVQKFINYGNVAVPVNDVDMAALKGLSDPSIKLLGFKPITTLGLDANVRSALLVRPDGGSELVFSTLLRAMKAKAVYAICRYTANASAVPFLAALFPSNPFDPLIGQSNLLSTDCLWLIRLPYREDFRSVEDFLITKEGTLGDTSYLESQVDAAQNVVDSLPIILKDDETIGTLFTNPALQHHYSYIEARALMSSEISEIEDKTWVSDDVFNQVADDIMALTVKAPKEPKKRASRVKSEPISSADAENLEADLKNRMHAGTLEKLTKPILTEFLRSRGISGLTSLKKAELIEKVKELLQ